MVYTNTLEFAKKLDAEDELSDFRNKFFIPKQGEKEVIYFNGNSLGLQPKSVLEYLQIELDTWAKSGVKGHFNGNNGWMHMHERLMPSLAKIVGAKPEEVVPMSQLTVNLHLLMVSFYNPTKTRYKIICEARAFPSDQYALETQVRFHGYDPAQAIIEVKPRKGEHVLRTEDILETIHKHGESISLVLFGGINYLTGQLFDIEKITTHTHSFGAYAGFDLAHAAGNVLLKLHEWNVDFACWCSYKYLNSGPGGVGGIFVHERNISNSKLNRFAGWWGYNKETRFLMEKGFKPIPTAEGWQISNTPVLNLAAHLASLEIFEEAGIDKLHKKRLLLTGYLHFLLNDINARKATNVIEIITPESENERGCQISMLMHARGREIFENLNEESITLDWREPNIIRVAPVPLYNTFKEVFLFGQTISNVLEN